MAWSINIYIYLNLASSVPVGRSMFRRPHNFHDAGRSNQSCMRLNLPNYEASLVSHAQLSPFRWYNRHTLQLDDVEYILKKYWLLTHSIISTTQHITIRQSLLNPTTSYSARLLMEITKKRSACHHFDSCVSHRMAWLFSLAGRGIESRGKDWKHEIEQHLDDQIFYHCTNVYVTPRPSTRQARWPHLLKEIWLPWFPFMRLPSNDMAFSIWYGHQITRKFVKIIKTAFWGPNTWPGHQRLLQITISHSAHFVGIHIQRDTTIIFSIHAILFKWYDIWSLVGASKHHSKSWKTSIQQCRAKSSRYVHSRWWTFILTSPST